MAQHKANLYMKREEAEIGAYDPKNAANFWRTVVSINDEKGCCGGKCEWRICNYANKNKRWVNTIVSPSETGTTKARIFFALHLVVWVVAMVLSITNNLAVGAMQANTTGCAHGDPTCFSHEVTSGTMTIGILGGVATILGVVGLLFGAAYWTADDFGETVLLSLPVQFLTLFGMFSTIFVFSRATSKTENAAYWVGLFAVLFTTYAQVLLYCTSAAIKTKELPRSFIPSAAFAIQIISAIAISNGEWHTAADSHFTDGQKVVAWLLPSFLGLAMILMMIVRSQIWLGVGEEDDLASAPFSRSLVLFAFVMSGVFSVHVLSFTRNDPDPIVFMFSFAGTLLTFAIITVVFVPSARGFGKYEYPVRRSNKVGDSSALLAKE